MYRRGYLDFIDLKWKKKYDLMDYYYFYEENTIPPLPSVF